MLSFIISKGHFDTIEYLSDEKIFIIRKNDNNNTIIKIEATKEELDKIGIGVPLEHFEDGFIYRPVRIPNTYKKIEDDSNIFYTILNIFSYPIKGLIESADIGFFLMIIGGTLKVLQEFQSFSKLKEILTKMTKERQFFLLVGVLIVIAIGGTTFGMQEEILSFYPILMPIFLEMGFDGLLSMAPLYLGVICGNMFCTINTTSVVLASILSGIDYIDEIIFRIVGLIFVIIMSVIYLLRYYRRIDKNPQESYVYEIRKEILEHFDIQTKQKNKEEKEKNKEDEESDLTSEKSKLKGEETGDNRIKFKFGEFIPLILCALGFVIIIVGIVIFKWSFIPMTTVFFILAIILMIILHKGEKEAIKIFMEGAGKFCGVVIITGILRGISLTLIEEKILDTILNAISNMVDGLQGCVFGIVMLLIYIFLGFFIQSYSALAMISISPFVPLADKANCNRAVIVNAYLLGQSLIALISPTGLILIVNELVAIDYIYWIKFIWLFFLLLLVLSVILIIIDSYLS